MWCGESTEVKITMSEPEASGSEQPEGPQGRGTNQVDEAGTVNETAQASVGNVVSEQEGLIKNRRKQQRNKFTRAINRVRGAITDRDSNRRRLIKEMQCIRQIYEAAGEAHSELYDYVADGDTRTLDQWETNLANDLYDIEIEVEDYLKTLNNNINIRLILSYSLVEVQTGLSQEV